MGVEPKNWGKTPQIIHFNRVWNHDFHHPFWGVKTTPIFWVDTHIIFLRPKFGLQFFIGETWHHDCWRLTVDLISIPLEQWKVGRDSRPPVVEKNETFVVTPILGMMIRDLKWKNEAILSELVQCFNPKSTSPSVLSLWFFNFQILSMNNSSWGWKLLQIKSHVYIFCGPFNLTHINQNLNNTSFLSPSY